MIFIKSSVEILEHESGEGVFLFLHNLETENSYGQTQNDRTKVIFAHTSMF